MSIKSSWLIVLFYIFTDFPLVGSAEVIFLSFTISNIRIQIKTRFPNCNKIFFASALFPHKAPLLLVFIIFPTALNQSSSPSNALLQFNQGTMKSEKRMCLFSLERIHLLEFALHIFVCTEMWDYLLSVNLSVRINKNYSLIFPITSSTH